MSDRRFYVSLTATCEERALSTVLDRMSAAIPTLSTLGLLDGLSLSYTAGDLDELASDGTLPTALPVAGPVTSTGPGTPPPDAVDMPIVEPEPGAETSWREGPTDDTPESQGPTVDALSGQHADPEPLP